MDKRGCFPKAPGLEIQVWRIPPWTLCRMSQTTYFLRDSWMELISLFKLEVLVFCSTKFILVSNYNNVSIIPSMAPFQHYKHTCSSICKSTRWVYHILQIKFPLIKLPSSLVPVTEGHNSLVFRPLVSSSSARSWNTETQQARYESRLEPFEWQARGTSNKFVTK